MSPGIVRPHFAGNTHIGTEAFEGFVTMLESQAPLARAGSTLGTANTALFLASDCASYMTVADLLINGGWMSV